VNSVAEAVVALRAGFDVIQLEKFSPEAVRTVAAACSQQLAPPILAAAGGIYPDNAAAYAEAGANILVTSWPYTARPVDAAMTIDAAG
jgi:molybdenum transport protein